MTFPVHPLHGSVWWWDWDAGNAETRVRGRTTGSGGPSDTRVSVLPRPTDLAFIRRVSTASRRSRRLPTSVSLDLVDSHLDEQDVADDAVWSLLRQQLQRGSLQFVVAGPPSSTFAPPFWETHQVYGMRRSTARTRGLHPSQVERSRIASLLADRSVRSWKMGFLVLQSRACPASSSLFDMAPYVVLRAGPRRTDFRLPSVDTNPLGQPLHWKVVLSALKAQFDHPSDSVLCALLVIPALSTPALQPLSPITCARNMSLWAQRLWDLARPSRNSRIVHVWAVCAALTCPVPIHSGYKVAGTRISAMLEGFVDDFPQNSSVVADLRSGKPTCCFGGGLLAHIRRQWLQLLGRSVSPPPAGPDPDDFEAWGVAVGDWDAETILPWGVHGILKEVETAGVYPPCHVDEQPKKTDSLHTCLAGWSNCASAEDEPEVVNQLLHAQQGVGHTPELLGRGPCCAVQACSPHHA